MKKACLPGNRHFFPSTLGRLASFFFSLLLICPSFSLHADNAAPAGAAIASEQSRPAAGNSANPIEHSVVKVFVTTRLPDPFKPWTKQAPQETSGSGIIVEGKRILTNAHVVLYASQVQVQANQEGDKFSATVEAIAPGTDLAVLALEDETFFDTRLPLKRANDLPGIKDAVMAYGFPAGGTNLSITKGIVSRIEFTSYN